MTLISKEEQEELSWGIILERHALKPFLDRVIVKKDKEESKYACKNCEGRGHTNETCEHCLGTGKEPRKRKTDEEELCRECIIKGELDRAYGKKVCPVCLGKKGVIVKPDNQKQKTLTGVVIAVGEEAKFVKRDMRVMFTNYTGIDFVIDGVELMYCSEKDLIGQYKQLNKEAFNENIQEKTHEELAALGVGDSNLSINN